MAISTIETEEKETVMELEGRIRAFVDAQDSVDGFDLGGVIQLQPLEN